MRPATRRRSGPAARLVPPPRRVPFTLRVRVLFGGWGAFAWGFLSLTSLLAALFLRKADLTSWYWFRSDVEYAAGEIAGCSRANGASTGGAPWFENRFRFTVDGETTLLASYALGQCLEAGRVVAVEYPPGRPRLARIAGMQRAAFPAPAAAIAAFFPAVGLILVAIWTWYVWRPLRLLARGKVALGTLVGSQATNLELVGPDARGGTVTRMRFAFQTEDGATAEAAVRTWTPGRLDDDPREVLLYDPSRPERAVAWDVLEGSPRVDAAGELKPASSAWGALRLLIVPASVVALPALVLYVARALERYLR